MNYREKLPHCPACEEGRLQYLINVDAFVCDRCKHEVQWSDELNKRFYRGLNSEDTE